MGIVITGIGVAATVALLFDDLDSGVAVLIGVILVVLGPTVGHSLHPGELLLSIGVGALIGPVGALVLWLLLREVVRDAPEMVVPAPLMVVVAAVVAADLLQLVDP